MEFLTILLLFSSIPAVCFPKGGSALCPQVLPVRTPRPVRRFIALSALPAGARGHFVLQRYELFGALTKVAAFAAGSSRWCRIVFHTGSPAERQLFRTDFRFAPSPRRASLAVPPIHGTWASTVCAEEFPTPLEMSLHGLHLLRQTQISRPICTDCLRHLRISAG